MSVALTNKFWTHARGLTFTDGGGLVWSFNQNNNSLTATGSSGSLLSSVALVDNSGTFTITGSPLTANGTIDLALAAQSANHFLAGPSTGSPAAATWRLLTAADLPSGAFVTSIGSSNLTIGGTASVPTINLSSTQVTNIGLGGTALQSVSVIDSISGAGTSASKLQLVGDSAAPGNSFYYGTNSSGTKGWYASVAAPTGANPTGTIGLAANNGTATTWMRSDATPALGQGIVPTWSGFHTFGAGVGLTNGTGVVPTSSSVMDFFSNSSRFISTGASGSAIAGFQFVTGSVGQSIFKNAFVVNVSGGVQASIVLGNATDNTPVYHYGPIGVNGATPPAQSTGWGTSTNGAVVANYNASLATLLQTADVVAQFITIFKALGFLGA